MVGSLLAAQFSMADLNFSKAASTLLNPLGCGSDLMPERLPFVPASIHGGSGSNSLFLDWISIWLHFTEPVV